MSTKPLELAQLRSALSEADHPWTMTETSMTRMTEEQRTMRLGVPLDDDMTAQLVKSRSAAAAAAAHAAPASSIGAPTSFDLRNVNGVNYTTSVKNQGGCGSCVAFGSVATIEAVARYGARNADLPVDLSEAHLFYDLGKASGASCANGWWPELAAAVAQAEGVTFEDYYPYVAGQPGTVNAAWRDHCAKVTGWRNISNNAAAIKESIATRGSVVACLVVYQDFFSYSSGVYRHLTGSQAGGHCVSLVGYDDAAGCWIAKNSWGSNWGQGGYVRIAYGECLIDSWRNIAIDGVSFRTWWPDQQISGLWTNDVEANVWAYASQRRWLRLDGGVAATVGGMQHALEAAKSGGRQVGIFEDAGSIKQIYAW